MSLLVSGGERGGQRTVRDDMGIGPAPGLGPRGSGGAGSERQQRRTASTGRGAAGCRTATAGSSILELSELQILPKLLKIFDKKANFLTSENTLLIISLKRCSILQFFPF